MNKWKIVQSQKRLSWHTLRQLTCGLRSKLCNLCKITATEHWWCSQISYNINSETECQKPIIMKVDVRVLVCFFHLLLCQILIFEKTKKYHLHGTALNANVMVVSHEQTTAHVYKPFIRRTVLLWKYKIIVRNCITQ